MKVSLIIFPGSNCDNDAKIALEKLIKAKVNMVWHKETSLPKTDLIVLPGGFSYGDYLRPGSIASKSHILFDIIKNGKKGTPILGICNGFQILTEAKLLPGTLTRNIQLKFICENTYLRVVNNDTISSSRYNNNEIINIPIAHHDGNYFAPDHTINELEDSNRIIFKYCDKDGFVTKTTNPNGSINNIAGIVNDSKNILGMMPHPERAYDPLTKNIDGTKVFTSLLDIIL